MKKKFFFEFLNHLNFNFVLKFKILSKLFRETGLRHLFSLSMLSFFKTISELGSITILISFLFLSIKSNSFLIGTNLSIKVSIFFLISFTFLRGISLIFINNYREIIRTKFAEKLKINFIKTLFDSTLNELRFISRGELLGLITHDIDRTTVALDNGILLVQSFISLLIYLFGIIVFGENGILPILLAFLTIVISSFFSRSYSWEIGLKQNKLNDSIQRTLSDSLYGIKTIKATGSEDWLIKSFKKTFLQIRYLYKEIIFKKSLFISIRDFFYVCILSIWILSNKNLIDTSLIAATAIFAYKSLNSITSMVTTYRLMSRALPAYEKLCKIRLKISNKNILFKKRSLNSGLKNIYRNQSDIISFSWETTDKKNNGINKVNLKSNSIVVITGKSGVGKTTVMDNIMGFLNNEKSIWKISTNKENYLIKGDNTQNLISKIVGYCPQEGFLFEGTLFENIFFENKSSINKIERINKIKKLNQWIKDCKIDSLYKDIERLEDNLNLTLNCFSGGEIKRLSLIRTWIMDKKIELLDEPTAYLDNKSKKNIKEIISKRGKDKLILITTNDVDLIDIADIHLELT